MSELVFCSTENDKICIESDNTLYDNLAIYLSYDLAVEVRDFINENLEQIKPKKEKEMNEGIEPRLDDEGNLVFHDNDGDYMVMSPARIQELQEWLENNPEFLNLKSKYDFPPHFKKGTILKHTKDYGWAFHDAKNLVTSLRYLQLIVEAPDVPEGTSLATVFIKD